MHSSRSLTFETLLRDPLVREVMRSDGVSVQDLLAALCTARAAVAARDRAAARRAMRGRLPQRAAAAAPDGPPPSSA